MESGELGREKEEEGKDDEDNEEDDNDVKAGFAEDDAFASSPSSTPCFPCPAFTSLSKTGNNPTSRRGGRPQKEAAILPGATAPPPASAPSAALGMMAAGGEEEPNSDPEKMLKSPRVSFTFSQSACSAESFVMRDTPVKGRRPTRRQTRGRGGK